MKRQLGIVVVGLWLCGQVMGMSSADTIAIKNGIVFTVTQGIIEQGQVLIREGKIVAVGKDIAIPDEAYVIDASGMSVLPGFIDGFSNLGGVDIEPQNQDFDEATAPITPHLRIIDAINPENRFISLARKHGITAVLCAPGEGNLLSGQSALIHLHGKYLEDMVVRFPVAVHGNMGEMPKLRYGEKNRYPSTRMGEAALLRQTLTDAQAYKVSRERKEPPPVDFKFEALLPVLSGKLPLMVRANRMDDILTVLRIVEEYKIKLILNHGADAYRVAQKLAEHKIPVVVGPVFSQQLREETSRAILENPALLHKAGVKIAFQTGSFRHYGDLLYQVEMAVKHGLPREVALKAVTLNPAEIFGVADKLGSLETGKIANVVLFKGEPFKTLAKPVAVILRGQIVEPIKE